MVDSADTATSLAACHACLQHHSGRSSGRRAVKSSVVVGALLSDEVTSLKLVLTTAALTLRKTL